LRHRGSALRPVVAGLSGGRQQVVEQPIGGRQAGIVLVGL